MMGEISSKKQMNECQGDKDNYMFWANVLQH